LPTPSFPLAAELLVAYWRRSATQDMTTRDLCQRLTEWLHHNGHAELEWGVRHGRAPDLARIQGVLEVACGDFTIRNLLFRLAPPSSEGEGASYSSANSRAVGTIHVAGGAPQINVVTGGTVHFHSQPATPEVGAAPAERGQEQMSILLLAAGPRDLERLYVEEEIRAIALALEQAPLRNSISLKHQLATRPEDLPQRLLSAKPRYVHFSGHGEFCLQDSFGHAHPIGGDVLAKLFDALPERVECVVLSACYSGKQIEAIAQYVPYVIGMREAVTDQFVTAFSMGFYQAVGSGCGPRDAFKLACAQLRVHAPRNRHAPTIPILFEHGRPMA
jgi:hypothetical protein